MLAILVQQAKSPCRAMCILVDACSGRGACSSIVEKRDVVDAAAFARRPRAKMVEHGLPLQKHGMQITEAAVSAYISGPIFLEGTGQ